MSKKLRNSRRNISRGHSHISIRRRIRYYYVRFMQVSIVLLVLGAVLILKAPYFTSTRQDFAIQLQEMRDTMIPWSIEHIEIIGNRHLSKEQIVQILDIDIGTPIFHVDIEKSLQALSDNGWVQAAIIKRILPNTLLIELV